MAQIYKVFKDNTAFFLTNNANSFNNSNQNIIRLDKSNNIIELIENESINKPDKTIIIICENLKKTITSLEEYYKPKVAAGGWVFNIKNELLFIKRWGIWDIPKGHLEKNESLEECAIREVEEETGLNKLEIVEKIGISRHIFSRNGKEKIKETHWYKMKTSFDGKLKPQTEEDIEEVKWVNSLEINSYIDKSWKSLNDFYNSSVLNKNS